MMASWALILCVLLAIHMFALEALAERAKSKGGITLYRPPVGFRLVLGAALIGMVYGAGVVALSDKFGQDWWVSVLLLGLAIFCASQWPADIGVSESGIFEKKWLGLRKRAFPWEDIASAKLNPVEDSIWVATKSGATIKNQVPCGPPSIYRSGEGLLDVAMIHSRLVVTGRTSTSTTLPATRLTGH